MNIKLRNLLRPKMVLCGLLMAVTLATGYGFVTRSTVEAAVDCDSNAVIKCGYSDLSDFMSKFQTNSYGDLQNIYGYWGLDDVEEYVASAQHVTVYKNGEVKLDDGTVVATNAYSLGRQSIGSNRKSIVIAGTTYYYSSTSDSFASSSLDGYALFNSDDHSMTLATLKACGNPVWGTSPGYKCEMLEQTKISDTEYEYLATPYVKDGATVTKIVYDFGDGESVTVTDNFDQSVTHTYTPGDYTATATVYFDVNGTEESDTRESCTKPVSVPEKEVVYVCTDLIATQVSGSASKYTFTADSETENAVLKSATFNFDDNSTVTVDTEDGSTVSTTYNYTEAGEHTTSVDLVFDQGSDIGNANCVVTTTTTEETTTTTEETPTSLPSTGIEEIASATLGLGSLTGAGVYYRRSRLNVLDKIFKR